MFPPTKKRGVEAAGAGSGVEKGRVNPLRLRPAESIALRHVFRDPVTVDIGANPVHVQHAMIGPIRDHPAELAIESGDDRLRIRTRSVHGRQFPVEGIQSAALISQRFAYAAGSRMREGERTGE